VIVCVPTYNRPELFARLLTSIAEQDATVTVVAFDDASREPYARAALRASGLAHVLERAPKNLGRHGYRHVVRALLQNPGVQAAKASTPLAFLADDLVFVPDGVERARMLLTRAPRAEGCLGVSLHTDHRDTCWGLGCEALDEHGDRLAWQDGAWLARVDDVEHMLPTVPRRAGAPQPAAGTGVWYEVSARLSRSDLWWYRPRRSLTHHDDQGTSVLNPWWNGRPGRAVHTRT
jgi:glycosyltransferase involved in cell wall biosynthesis